MNLKNVFRRVVLLSAIMFISCAAFSVKAFATTVDNYNVPGQNALQEIIEGQGETIVIGESGTTTEPSAVQNSVDIEYSGKIDATTGEGVVGNIVSSADDYYVLRRNELAFDANRQKYHILCGDRGLYCNMPAGALLTNGESLKITLDEGVSCEIYLDGDIVEDNSQREFYESGEYLIVMRNHAEAKERNVRFVIADSLTNSVKEYRLPDGFEYTEVKLDGVRKSVEYNNYYDFLEDGFYQLKWENSRINQTFVTEFTLDLTAPKLELPEVRSGAATGRVSFADMEEGEYVRWIRDSREEGRIEDSSEVLSKKGNYVLRVYDQAGNYTEYTFAIEGYFDVNAVLAILLVIALLGGGFLYCRRLRTHMRVG